MGKLEKVGYVYHFNSKQGGGSYAVVGHVNCSRCKTIIEEREQLEPTKAQRKTGRYYIQYRWCWKCGLYESVASTLTFIKLN